MKRSGWQAILGAWLIASGLVACGGGGSSAAPAPAPQVSGAQHLHSEAPTRPASPPTLGGQRITLAAPHNLAATMALLDPLSADASTVAFTQQRSGFALVELAGLLAGTPTETAHDMGDRDSLFDCGAATIGAAVSTCRSNTSLSDALTAGISSASDDVTYRLADGTMRSMGGVSIWVANTTRPLSSTLTLALHCGFNFALNGHVYTGALIPDGTLIGSSYHVSNPAAVTF
jgi:hypothetical protein